ncbi:hypothetical protein GOBAR_DD01544 [Gossypium barbadense]|nr:hypothetical protein GOBAR_DD01544 [Gossypium barbadense]
MVQVDETWLYEKYTQILLIAVAQDDKRNVLSIAFAIVESHELEPQIFRQRFTRLESQMLSLPIDLRTWLVCARANLNVEQFIDQIYTLQRTLRIWGNEFPIIHDVLNWEVPPPAFEMVPGRSLRRHPKGRPQSMSIQNDMDFREIGEPKLCTVCRTFEHNRSTCPHRGYVSGQLSRNARLEDDE